jgi:hypothetical protein
MQDRNGYEEDKLNTNNLDEIHNEDMDEEDHEPEYTEHNSSSAESLVKKIDFNRIKRILLPLYIVFVIFLFYKFLGWYSHHKQLAEEKKGAQETSQVAKPAATPKQIAPQQAAIQPLAPATPTPPAINEEIILKVESLVTQTQQHSDQLSHLTNTINEQKVAIDTLTTSLASLASSVDDLNNTVHKIAKSMRKPKRKVTKPAPRKAVYHIKAIVPNRAWLEDAEKRTITVRLGDLINGGTVEVISPYQGVVALSNGEVIQFGANDI